MIGDDKEGVQPWILVPEGPVRDLLFAYEAVLTEMRTWANSDVRIIAEWVRRIDNERDTFVQSQSEKESGQCDPESKRILKEIDEKYSDSMERLSKK